VFGSVASDTTALRALGEIGDVDLYRIDARRAGRPRHDRYSAPSDRVTEAGPPDTMTGPGDGNRVPAGVVAEGAQASSHAGG
jgi:hypothetical protein